jgi:Fe2+ transport system protein FeoA
MSAAFVDCPLCGHRYPPQGHVGCPACPISAGCATLCCPACGYSTIDPSGSALLRLFRRKTSLENNAMTLADIAPGGNARVAGFSNDLPFPQREHLQAYGLVEGRTVRVLLRSPATVVRIEHLELAMEAELAGKIRVERQQAPERNRMEAKAR